MKLTCGGMVNDFLAYCRVSRTLSDHTLRAYTQDLGEYLGYLEGQGGETPVEEEDEAFLTGYIGHLKEARGLAPATVRRRIACLKGFFKWRERQGTVETSPFRRMEVSLRIPRRLPRSLSREELRDVLATSDLHASPAVESTVDARTVLALAVRVMVTTGVRVGELTTIRLADVSGDGGAIRIMGKGSRERTVYVGNPRVRGDLAAYVAARRREGAAGEAILLLAPSGAPLTPQGIRTRLRRISEALEMSPRLTPHRFRHTAATLLIEEGVDIRFVQRLLGHASIATTEIYTKISDVALRQMVEGVAWEGIDQRV